MDLVNTYHSNLAAKLAQVLNEEPLWRYEQDFDFLLLHCSEHFLLALVGEGRVDEGSRHEVWELLELVLHQCDQRRYNQDKAWHELAQKLID